MYFVTFLAWMWDMGFIRRGLSEGRDPRLARVI